MTARTSLSQAVALSQELDQVTAALAIVNAGTYTVQLVISGPLSAGFTMQVSPAQMALQTLLTNRQTALQSSLTALGVS